MCICRLLFTDLNSNPWWHRNLGRRSFRVLFTVENQGCWRGENFKMVDGVLFDKEMTRLVWCSPKKGEYEIPHTVKTIDSMSFQLCYKLTSIAISDSVTEIPSHAFRGCYGLEKVIIPRSVVSIGVKAFALCFRLMTISVPEGLEYPPTTFPLCARIIRY